MKKKTIVMVLLLVMSAIVLLGCSSSKPTVPPLVPSDYENASEGERVEYLEIFVAYDVAEDGEYKITEFSEEGIVEQVTQPFESVTPEDEDADVSTIALGGGNLWFKGVAPGDVLIVFTIVSDRGEGDIKAIEQYAVRVYDDLSLSVLAEQHDDFR